MTTEVKRLEYSMRFRSFMRQLFIVSRMKPKEDYLYALMDTVPFKDLEVAILMTNLRHEANANDNHKRL